MTLDEERKWRRVREELEAFYEIYNMGEFIGGDGFITDDALESIELLIEAYEECLE